MTFTPVNNYLYVKAVGKTADEVPDCQILLPQEYRSVENPFAVVEIINCSGESGTLWDNGLRVIVEAQMLQDISHQGEVFTVIKENHVIGILSD
jgi:hypothetical protein